MNQRGDVMAVCDALFAHTLMLVSLRQCDNKHKRAPSAPPQAPQAQVHIQHIS